jgi:hypothetical protein
MVEDDDDDDTRSVCSIHDLEDDEDDDKTTGSPESTGSTECFHMEEALHRNQLYAPHNTVDPSTEVDDVLLNFSREDAVILQSFMLDFVEKALVKQLTRFERPVVRGLSRADVLAMTPGVKAPLPPGCMYLQVQDLHVVSIDPSCVVRAGTATMALKSEPLCLGLWNAIRTSLGCCALSVHHCKQYMLKLAHASIKYNEDAFAKALSASSPVVVASVECLELKDMVAADLVVSLAYKPIHAALRQYRLNLRKTLNAELKSFSVPTFKHACMLDGSFQRMLATITFDLKARDPTLAFGPQCTRYLHHLVAVVSDYFESHTLPVTLELFRSKTVMTPPPHPSHLILKRYQPVHIPHAVMPYSDDVKIF